jgi:hypothetical protein
VKTQRCPRCNDTLVMTRLGRVLCLAGHVNVNGKPDWMTKDEYADMARFQGIQNIPYMLREMRKAAAIYHAARDADDAAKAEVRQ